MRSLIHKLIAWWQGVRWIPSNKIKTCIQRYDNLPAILENEQWIDDNMELIFKLNLLPGNQKSEIPK